MGLSKKASSGLSQKASSNPGISLKSSSVGPQEFLDRSQPETDHTLFDCCAALIHCQEHNKVALSKISQRKGYWFPFLIIDPTEGWMPSAVVLVRKVLSTLSDLSTRVTPPRLLQFLRLEIPGCKQFVMRLIFYTRFKKKTASGGVRTSCCQNNGLVTWFSIDDAIDKTNVNIWGPEVSVFIESFIQANADRGNLVEFTLSDAKNYAPRDPPTSYFDELLKSARLDEKRKDVINLYAEFVQHSYPAQFMLYPAFADYMRKIGWTVPEQDLVALFYAFSQSSHSYLSFHEFLLGLAAMDKHTAHGGHVGELRCGYIFRYYDKDGDGFLDYSEMTTMAQDILRAKDKTPVAATVENEVRNSYTSMGLQTTDRVTEGILLQAIGNMAIRGTSSLFRSTLGPITSLKRLYPTLESIKIYRRQEVCFRCREKKFTLDPYHVLLNDDGRVSDHKKLALEDGSNAKSDRLFDVKNIPNIALTWVRDYTQAVGVLSGTSRSAEEAKNFWKTQKEKDIVDVLVKLCSETQALLKSELRVLRINPPCLIFGDIHGNLHDLMLYERYFWRKGPNFESTNFLFLGDYVDRGADCIECVMFLFANKLLAPDKFNLLRGNHETRNLQKMFTFYQECQEKFENHGDIVFEAFNSAFDFLPVCAVIDDSIFCAHGGIPTNVQSMAELSRTIPVSMTEIESECPAAWEMLWNDPISSTEFGEYAEMIRLQSGSSAYNNLKGFHPNSKRGTAYFFSDEAVQDFLRINNLSHIVRAHECVMAGYWFHANGKVTTVFSTSKYQKSMNEAACILVDQEKIRILRLDTSAK